MKLEISDALLEEIRGHGARAYPHECCGALLGVLTDEGGKAVRALLPLDNRREDEAARTRFLVTADDYRRGTRCGENRQENHAPSHKNLEVCR